ncbi:MAG: sporulation protein YqfD [Lachnospiraceae bacterium]|nr:sporulation protein YqfD [Lachnospiraceae bacterium]
MGRKKDYGGNLRGKVGVRLTGRQTERFIKLCGMNGIELRRLAKEDDGKGYRFVIWADEFLLLRPYLKKTKCRARVISREGASFYLKRQRKRWLFPVGLLMGAAVLFGLSQFIWRIDIEGNVHYTDDVIYRFLEEQDVRFGTLKTSVYTAGLEETVRNNFEDITWVSVQLVGTHMTVSVKEDDQLEAEMPETENSHIVAAQEGVITSIVVRSGQTDLKEGDTIAAGQILISGAVELKDDGGNITGTKLVHADGEVYASVSYQYEDSFLLSHEVREYQEEAVNRYSLVLGTYRIPLPIFDTIGAYYDTVTERDQFYLGSDYYLPMYLEKTVYRSYLRRVEDYTEEEANAVAKERLDIFLAKLTEKGYEIQSSEIALVIQDGICTVTGSYTAISQIGKREVMAEEDDFTVEGDDFTDGA